MGVWVVGLSVSSLVADWLIGFVGRVSRLFRRWVGVDIVLVVGLITLVDSFDLPVPPTSTSTGLLGFIMTVAIIELEIAGRALDGTVRAGVTVLIVASPVEVGLKATGGTLGNTVRAGVTVGTSGITTAGRVRGNIGATVAAAGPKTAGGSLGKVVRIGTFAGKIGLKGAGRALGTIICAVETAGVIKLGIFGWSLEKAVGRALGNTIRPGVAVGTSGPTTAGSAPGETVGTAGPKTTGESLGKIVRIVASPGVVGLKATGGILGNTVRATETVGVIGLGVILPKTVRAVVMVCSIGFKAAGRAPCNTLCPGVDVGVIGSKTTTVCAGDTTLVVPLIFLWVVSIAVGPVLVSLSSGESTAGGTLDVVLGMRLFARLPS